MDRRGLQRPLARGNGRGNSGLVVLRLLLDTHILVWPVLAPRRLGALAKAAIVDPANTVFVSAAFTWEISIKTVLGRLGFPLGRLDDVLARMGIEALPIGMSHAIAAGRLPRHHDDPFDRMLIAQARQDRLVLVTDVAILGGTGAT